MAKAIKIAGAVIVGAGLVLATGGIAAGFTLGAALGAGSGVLGLSIGGLILAGSTIATLGSSLDRPKVPQVQSDRLYAQLNPRELRKTVLGQTAMPVDVRHEEWEGADQEWCRWIVAHASHAIDGVEEIWFGTEMAWSATTGVTARYRGYFFVDAIVLEGSPANALALSNQWNGTRHLTGCAYSAWRFKTTGNGKKAESPFSGGPPSRITVIGRGARLYDPRRDSTVPGGNGPMRADDPSTWRFVTDDGVTIGENLPLQILRMALGGRIRNPVTGELRLATGSGVPKRRINMPSFIVAANLADEQVNRSAGGTEPRYHGACVLSEGDEPRTWYEMLCAACNARFRDTGGKLSIDIAHNDFAAAATDEGLTTDDVVGPHRWEPDASLDEIPNIVRGRYVDASAPSLYQLIDYPEVRIPSLDGVDRILPLDLGAVESVSQAQRIARQALQRKQYPRTFTAPFDIRAWKYPVGALVPFTYAPLSFDRVLFRVREQELGQNGQCLMTLSYEHPSFYAWDADDRAPVMAADPIVYDASNNPLILAIDDAAKSADWSQVADDDGKRPEDGATVGGTIGRNIKNKMGEIIQPGDVLNSAIDLRPDGTLVVSIGDTIRPLGKINLIDLGAANDMARRQLETDLASLSAAVAQLAAGQAIVQNVFRDAGLFTDPASGVAKLFAIESRAEQISKLSVTLNAALASIELKASVNYVNDAILKAKLGGSDVDLSSILVRLTSAEANIFGLQGQVQLKADATVVTGLQGSVTSINQSLDALKAIVETKVSKTVVDSMGARLTLAEQTLNAFDGASLTTTLTSSRRAISEGDIGGANDILAALTAFDAGQFALAAIATAKTELTAKTDTNTSAIASLSLQLGVQIGAVNAKVSSVQTAQIEGDQAIANDLATYMAATNGSLAQVNTVLVAQTGINSSVAGMMTSLTSTVAGHTNTLKIYGESIDGLSGKWGAEFDSNGAITGFTLNNGGGRTDAVFVVDKFKIAKAGAGGATVVFSVADDGAIEMPNVRVGLLKAKSVTAENIVPGSVLRVSVQVLESPVTIPWG